MEIPLPQYPSFPFIPLIPKQALSLAVVAPWIGKQPISACKQASFVLVSCDQPACYITVYLNRPKIIGKPFMSCSLVAYVAKKL
jgi:hypothetical protein